MAGRLARIWNAVGEWIPGVQTGGFNPEFVPSQATLAQLEQYAMEGGSFDQSGFGLGVGSTVLPWRSPVLIRCVSLLSALVAQLVTRGGLRVVDVATGRQASMRTSSRPGRAMELLTQSPDGVQHAYGFVESCMSDLLLHGNALMRIASGGSLPSSLHRQAISDMGTTVASNGDFVYHTRDWQDPAGTARPVPRQSMVHAYWGSLMPSSGTGYRGRSFLALPPVRLLYRAIRAGFEGEGYVLEYFVSGAGMAPYAITYPGAMNEDQKLEASDRFYRRKGRRPVVLGKNAKVVPLRGEPQGAGTLSLREFQIMEVARLYGVPAPLVGQAASTWGSGIAELGRFAYRFGLQQHLDRFLAALSQRLLDRGYLFEIDPISIVRADPAALQAFLASALGGPNNPPWMTVQEARRWSGLPREPDGEYPEYQQVNGGGSAPPEEETTDGQAA